MTIQFIVDGNMDARSMQQRQDAWRRLAVSGENVQLNLARVEHLDSSGLGAMLFLYKRLTASRKRFEVINVQGQPLEFIMKHDAGELLAPSRERPVWRPFRFVRAFSRGGLPRSASQRA